MKILWILFLIFALVAAQQQPSNTGKRKGTSVKNLFGPGVRLTSPTIEYLYNKVPHKPNK